MPRILDNILFRRDPNNPATGFVGSSNLTMAGLSKQGELNVDVLDHDACKKLAMWFDDRWDDKFCLDISEELAAIIGQSWAGAGSIPPHHIYVKMAYHLSQEARAGLSGIAQLRSLVPDPVKVAAQNALRNVGRGLLK